MSLGTFFGGAAGGAEGELESQQEKAFKLKLQSAGIEQNLHAQSQLQAQGAAEEAAKYAREGFVSPETADNLGMLSGARDKPTGAPMSNKEAEINAEIVRQKMAMMLHPRPVGAVQKTDPATGILQETQKIDQNGLPIGGASKEPGADQRIIAANQAMTFANNVQNAKILYDALDKAGKTGPLMGRVTSGLGQFQGQVDELNNHVLAASLAAGPYFGQMSGGRFSTMAAKMVKGNVVGVTMTPQEANGLYYNGTYQAFRKLKQAGVPDSHIPPVLQQYMSVPRDQNGIPIDRVYNENDGSWIEGGSLQQINQEAAHALGPIPHYTIKK